MEVKDKNKKHCNILDHKAIDIEVTWLVFHLMCCVYLLHTMTAFILQEKINQISFLNISSSFSVLNLAVIFLVLSYFLLVVTQKMSRKFDFQQAKIFHRINLSTHLLFQISLIFTFKSYMAVSSGAARIVFEEEYSLSSRLTHNFFLFLALITVNIIKTPCRLFVVVVTLIVWTFLDFLFLFACFFERDPAPIIICTTGDVLLFLLIMIAYLKVNLWSNNLKSYKELILNIINHLPLGLVIFQDEKLLFSNEKAKTIYNMDNSGEGKALSKLLLETEVCDPEKKFMSVEKSRDFVKSQDLMNIHEKQSQYHATSIHGKIPRKKENAVSIKLDKPTLEISMKNFVDKKFPSYPAKENLKINITREATPSPRNKQKGPTPCSDRGMFTNSWGSSSGENSTLTNKIFEVGLCKFPMNQNPNLILRNKAANNPDIVTVSLVDMTEGAKYRALEEHKEFKMRMLSGFSHELKTPLNGTISLIDCAIEDMGASLEYKSKYLLQPQTSLKILNFLISDIVDYLKHDTRQLLLQLNTFKLKPMIYEIIQIVEMKAKDKNIKLNKNFTNLPDSFSTDLDRTKRILLNLLFNCVKYTFYGSIDLNLEYSNECLQINIKDTRYMKPSTNSITFNQSFASISSLKGKNSEYDEIIEHDHLTETLPNEDKELGLYISKLLANKLGPHGNQGIIFAPNENLGVSYTLLIKNRYYADKAIPEKEIAGTSSSDSLKNFSEKRKKASNSSISEDKMPSINDSNSLNKIYDMNPWRNKFSNQQNTIPPGSATNTLNIIPFFKDEDEIEEFIPLPLRGFTSNKEKLRHESPESQGEKNDSYASDKHKNTYISNHHYQGTTSNHAHSSSQFSNPNLQVVFHSKSFSGFPFDSHQGSPKNILHKNEAAIESSEENKSNELIKSREGRASIRLGNSKSIIDSYHLKKGLENILEHNKKKLCTCPTALVVDDDTFNLYSLKVMLEKMNIKVITAMNGQQAILSLLEFYSKKPECKCDLLQVIFMDLNMPIMDGFEASKKILELMNSKEIPEVPIIACSANDSQEDFKKCAEAGMKGFLPKPVTMLSLEKVLNKYL